MAPGPSSVADTTIAAVATAPGEGGVGIVRLSGSRAHSIGAELTGLKARPREIHFTHFRDGKGEAIDHGLLLYFRGPASFTGEDVVELHGHGGPVVLSLLLSRCLALGATLARPGEFSERAFLNGKLDLAQAEAVADLIAASTQSAARAASRSLEGAFSGRVNALLDALIEARVHVEAAIDFPDEEDVDFLADPLIGSRLDALARQLDELLASAQRGRLLRTGLQVALTGRPNAGKSSLLNALSESDAAIVTPVPGTTRDVLRERIQIEGIALHIADTAGIRDSDDQIEAEGVRRARREVEQADIVLHVVDEAEADVALQPNSRTIIVRNKIDLAGQPPGVDRFCGMPRVSLSALTGAGLDQLREVIVARAGLGQGQEAPFTARARHLDALQRTRVHVAAGREHLATSAAGELVAEELRLAQDALGEITGRFYADDLLGEIFSSFCIGK